ncbi:serine hydrolase domain-containing protein [Streptomyces sp. NPDC057702]|uniref:serine hydrolase domain-containing protein n=1 Tax=unclassified Streptomyces TaxID=2593676 RepID=UPI0036867E4C
MRARAIRTAVVGATAIAALGAAVLTAPVAGATGSAGGPARAAGHTATQAAMDAQVSDAGVPGVLAQARDGRGVWNGDAGVADLRTGAPRGENDRYRVGSITKTFTATVMLQLRAEGKVDLDAPVETYLPDLVRGNGHDGRRITVRQLLNHTSGIFNYTADQEFADTYLGIGFLKHRYETLKPRAAVAIAMRHRPDFAPGTDWKYSNTNYLLAGLIIEKVTGTPYATQVQRRVIEPLGLRSTTLPGTRAGVPGPHGRGYTRFPDDPRHTTYDTTRLNPSWGWSAGEIISTNADINRFYAALLQGRLLPRAELAEMKRTVSVGGNSPARYGLGIAEAPLSCGTKVWGHDGGIAGSVSYAFSSEDARHQIALNFNGDWSGDGVAVLNAEFCGTSSGTGTGTGTGSGSGTATGTDSDTGVDAGRGLTPRAPHRAGPSSLISAAG